MFNFFKGKFHAVSDDELGNVNGGVSEQKLDTWYTMMQNKDYDGLKNDSELVSLMGKYGYEFVDGGVQSGGKFMSYDEAFSMLEDNWSTIKMFARFL